jgi:hypothetical protein
MIQLLFALICTLSRLQSPACSRSFVSFTSSPDGLRRTLYEPMIFVHALRTFRVAETPSNDRAVCVHLEIDTSMLIYFSCAQDSACSTSGTNGIAKARSLCTKPSLQLHFVFENDNWKAKASLHHLSRRAEAADGAQVALFERSWYASVAGAGVSSKHCNRAVK